MGAAAAWAVPVVLGAAGLYQQNKNAQDQKHMQDKALRGQGEVDAFRLEQMRKLGALADGYNPQAETDAAVNRASEVSSHTLANALRNLSADYRSQGGVPGLSSDYMVRATGTANRVLDPLKSFAAEQAATATQRKAALLQAASGAAPGQVGEAYFRAASQMPQTSGMGSFAMLLQGIQQLSKKKDDSGSSGAGGSGDTLLWQRPNQTQGEYS